MSAGVLCSRKDCPGICRQASTSFRNLGTSAADGLVSAFDRGAEEVSDLQATQFWDKGRLVSHSMGEHDRHSVVWDYIALYAPGAAWENGRPEALYHGGPAVRVVEPAAPRW